VQFLSQAEVIMVLSKLIRFPPGITAWVMPRASRFAWLLLVLAWTHGTTDPVEFLDALGVNGGDAVIISSSASIFMDDPTCRSFSMETILNNRTLVLSCQYRSFLLL
jgi:hypothetical protein